MVDSCLAVFFVVCSFSCLHPSHFFLLILFCLDKVTFSQRWAFWPKKKFWNILPLNKSGLFFQGNLTLCCPVLHLEIESRKRCLYFEWQTYFQFVCDRSVPKNHVKISRQIIKYNLYDHQQLDLMDLINGIFNQSYYVKIICHFLYHCVI